jgi:hypothetical protein
MGNYDCDYCRKPVEMRTGRKTGLLFYNCAACGLRANFEPDSPGWVAIKKELER